MKGKNGLVFIQIAKIDEEQRIVEGYATTDAVDLDGEIVDLAATREAVEEYRQWSNVRYMHQAHAVGVVKEMNVDEKGLYVKVKVVDEECWTKVKEGVLKAFSIGFRVLDCVWDAIKEAWRITKYRLIEISLVDRPCNPECAYTVVKRAYDAEAAETKPDNLFMKFLALLGLRERADEVKDILANFPTKAAGTTTQEESEMNDEQVKKLVADEVGKAKGEILTELGGKIDELKAAMATPAPAADVPKGADAPMPETPAEPAPADAAKNADEQIRAIDERLKGLEAGASKAGKGQDDVPAATNEKWSGVLDNVFR